MVSSPFVCLVNPCMHFSVLLNVAIQVPVEMEHALLLCGNVRNIACNIEKKYVLFLLQHIS
jgi:hypothetical protein